MARGRRLVGLLRNTRCSAAFAATTHRRCASTFTPPDIGASGRDSHARQSSSEPQIPATAAATAQEHPHALSAIAAGRLPIGVPAYIVWGANTNVGKTLVSVGLAHAAVANKVPLSYVKPVQTGFPADSDARLVALACGGSPKTGTHAAETAALRSTAAAPPPPEAPASNATPATHGINDSSGSSSTAAHVTRCTTLFAWQHAVSAHLAARLEGRTVGDDQLVATTAVHVRQVMEEIMTRTTAAIGGAAATAAAAATASEGSCTTPVARSTATASDSSSGGGSSRSGGMVLVETAGGVTSPAPSGRLMCDVLRPLRLPSILVGDPRLGGIAATLSAYDSLVSRGWDVEAVVLVGQDSVRQAADDANGTVVPLDNLSFLREYLSGTATAVHRMGSPPPLVVGVPACPPPPPGHDVRQQGLDPALRDWLPASLPAFTSLLDCLRRRHQQRLTDLTSAAAAAEAQIWWPFTQHAGLTHGSATVIDSRCGEVWTTLPPHSNPSTSPPSSPSTSAALVPLYDASGSWWTQAVTSDLHPDLARAVSYAAGRYLHVLFPEVAHTPALAAASALLAGPGAGWAERVFFSDDGSTAIEVALKMAFRKFLADRGELGAEAAAASAGTAAAAAATGSTSGSASSSSSTTTRGGGGELLVLGLRGGYHGDTLGSQDCVAASPFNGPLQSPWYRGRGLFLEPPYVGMRRGRWQLLDPPAWLSAHHPGGPLPSWASLEEMLEEEEEGEGTGSGSSSNNSSSSASAALAAAYRSYISCAIDEFEASLAAARSAGSGAAGSAGAPSGRLAACIMEPLLQGAGGMLAVHPAFQRAVAEVCRARRLPLILDEVFTGLLRTGLLTAASALRITPDIACYGKLLTGGAAPMAVTLASGEVFRAFSGPSKLFALLHGHSYTAYPIGCAATAASLELLTNPATNPNLCTPPSTPNQPPNRRLGGCSKNPPCTKPCGRLLPMWDEQLVSYLSYHPLVSRVVAVGTVLAIELVCSTTTTGGYGSVGAVQIVRRLRDDHGIYARPLGNVVYVMVPPTASPDTAAWLGGSLRAVLDAAASEAEAGAGAGTSGCGKGPEESVVV
ncbi:hypothetical protein Agub_g4527 [Astrephomene gubernaculifera]|uniref:Adenosylmethionine-8-amino-7-oxononanoate aminotransferase n=1 Tax=Astrephomene gubernaculifera TaxID=47775 RepID=A0AAD3HK94_9CHLO|nr:hypothetical protein Agub_g4527 [Astrephomene gubernaculifera]